MFASRFRTGPNRIAPFFREIFASQSIWVRLLDLLIFVLLAIAFLGGIRFRGHLYFKHSADLRRVAIGLGVVGYFFLIQSKEKSFFLKGARRVAEKLSLPRVRKICIVTGLFLAVALSVQRAFAMRVTLYDVGIFHQILWSLVNGFGFHSTISGAGNFLLDHFSPSLIFLTPFYALTQSSPLILPVIHPLLLFGGGIAWIYLASRVKNTPDVLRQKLAAATTVFVFSFESLWANLKWGFHENSIAFFSLSWAFALFFSESSKSLFKKNALILTLFLIAAGSKEILLLDVSIALMCWAVISKRRNKEWKVLFFSLFLGMISVGLFLGFIYFEKMVHPTDKNYFNRYYAYLGDNLNEFFLNLFRSPLSIFHAVGAKELIHYFFTVFSPWLFLPFLWKRKDSQNLWLLVALPSFASAALATYPPLRKSNFHYVLELWPVLACLSVVKLGEKKSSNWLWLWALLALFRMDSDPLSDFRELRETSIHSQKIRERLLSLPLDAAITADELAGTWISNRKWIMRWPETFLLPNQCPQYIVLRDKFKETEVKAQLNTLIQKCGSSARHSQPWISGDWEIYSLSSK